MGLIFALDGRGWGPGSQCGRKRWRGMRRNDDDDEETATSHPRWQPAHPCTHSSTIAAGNDGDGAVTASVISIHNSYYLVFSFSLHRILHSHSPLSSFLSHPLPHLSPARHPLHSTELRWPHARTVSTHRPPGPPTFASSHALPFPCTSLLASLVAHSVLPFPHDLLRLLHWGDSCGLCARRLPKPPKSKLDIARIHEQLCLSAIHLVLLTLHRQAPHHAPRRTHSLDPRGSAGGRCPRTGQQHQQRLGVLAGCV